MTLAQMKLYLKEGEALAAERRKNQAIEIAIQVSKLFGPAE